MPPLLSALKSVPIVDCILLLTNANVKKIIRKGTWKELEPINILALGYTNEEADAGRHDSQRIPMSDLISLI